MSEFVQVNLPSGCKLYEGIKPEDVQLRPLLGKEEEILAQLSAENFERKLPAVLKEVVRGVEIEQLTSGDHLFILIWEVINSYSNLTAVENTCEFCGSNIVADIDLGELEIIDLPEDYNEPYEVALSSGNKIKLRLLRVQDEIDIINFTKNSTGSSWLYRYAASIVDPELDAMKRMLFLSNLPAIDVAKVRAFHERFYHGPQLEAPYICSKCGKEGEISLPFCLLDILVPQGPALARIMGDTI